MKHVTFSILAGVTVLLLTSCVTNRAAQTPDQAAAAADADWPLTYSSGPATYTIFAPESDSWDGHELMGRSAVSVQTSGQSEPTYGVFAFKAITLVDKTTRTVTLANIKVTTADFPSASSQKPAYLASLQQNFPGRSLTLSLDRLEGSLTTADEVPKAEHLNNAPPKILIATRPAVLVYIDGGPALRPVSGTKLERVINTRMLLLKDPSGAYYLHLFDGYLKAPSLEGPWHVAKQAPDGAAVAEKQAVDAGQVDLMRGAPDAITHKEPSLASSAIPDVFVSTVPTELITFSGEPDFSSIPGTDLLYAANTSANVFELLTDQHDYVLISGRWYRAASLKGPWEFVPGNQLPSDFANIPDNSPKENVKASVPGTSQAEEALVANSIPQSAAVPRTDQMQNPQVDGTMQLAPITGTPLYYVANSATPIIEVDAQSWYACQNGVWYAATSANGPWVVAASVPAVIYTIPPTSPLHYLTYVQVYGSTPEVVYEGYTPGYLGTVVDDDGTVVYGTGYYYTPWIGSVWYGPPLTWGWGFDDCWTPWWGWGFDCGFGWGCGYAGFGWWGCDPPFPCWGGYRCWHDFDGDGWRGGSGYAVVANTGVNFYHHHGPGAGPGFAAGGRPGHHPLPADYGRAYNSRTGRIAAGQWARVQNVSGSAWNPGHGPGFARNNTFGVNYRQGFVNNNNSRWFSGSHPANQPGFRTWNAPRQQTFSGFRGGNIPPDQHYSGPASGFGGWHGGNAAEPTPHGGGWFHSIGNFFHGGGGGGYSGGGGGAGYRGGGGSHASGGGGGGGGGWGGGGHGGGGGFGGGGGGGGHGGGR